MQELMSLCLDAVIYHNDIHSFKKEWLEQKNDLKQMMNTCALTAILDDCSIEVAMIKIVDKSKDLENQIQLVVEKIKYLEFRKEFKTYANRILYLNSGNFYCGKVCDRYNSLHVY